MNGVIKKIRHVSVANTLSLTTSYCLFNATSCAVEMPFAIVLLRLLLNRMSAATKVTFTLCVPISNEVALTTYRSENHCRDACHDKFQSVINTLNSKS